MVLHPKCIAAHCLSIIIKFNIHKIILAAMISAIKYNEDNIYSMNFYAKLGGISTVELNLLEYKFLTMIHFSVFVEEELFTKYKDDLLDFQEEEEEEEEDEEEKEKD